MDYTNHFKLASFYKENVLRKAILLYNEENKKQLSYSKDEFDYFIVTIKSKEYILFPAVESTIFSLGILYGFCEKYY